MKCPTIGLEIEANWPSYQDACAEFQAALAAIKTPPPIRALRAQYLPVNSVWDPVAHGISTMNMMVGTSEGPFNGTNDIWKWYEENMPKKFHFPADISKEADGSAGMEIKFNGPVQTLEESESRIERMCRWMKDVGVSTFTNAGTHIHFGHDQFLRTGLGIQNTQDPLRKRAEALLLMGFATREKAIYALLPQSRQSNTFCTRNFSDTPNSFDTIPPKASNSEIHNRILSAATLSVVGAGHDRRFGLLHGSALVSFRHHPTMEMRYFPGTHDSQMVKGYLRLMLDLWDRLSPKVLDEKNLQFVKDSDVVVNPYTYTVEQLYQEVSTPWLKKWINATHANKGLPLAEVISEDTEQNRPVAA